MSSSTGKIVGVVVGVALLAGAVWLGMALIDVDQTEEGALPTIEVDGGELPEFDVDVGEVKVGTTTETVLVPEVEMVEEEIEVPVVGIQPPEDDGDE